MLKCYDIKCIYAVRFSFLVFYDSQYVVERSTDYISFFISNASYSFLHYI